MTSDGRHDFDFFHGTWHGAVRKLVDSSDRSFTRWTELSATCDCRPILGGLGNFETSAMSPGAIDGATLRLYEPDSATWRIWWMSTGMPGVLDAPVAGRFDGDRGVFEGPDAIGGTPIVVRYEWDRLDADRVHWGQRFSWDGGATWDDLNFVTLWTRTG